MPRSRSTSSLWTGTTISTSGTLTANMLGDPSEVRLKGSLGNAPSVDNRHTAVEGFPDKGAPPPPRTPLGAAPIAGATRPARPEGGNARRGEELHTCPDQWT